MSTSPGTAAPSRPERAPSTTGFLAPLRHRDFVLSLAIQAVSTVRQPLQFFAQAWFVNTAAPPDQRIALLGLAATLQGLAYLTWVLFGAAISDRIARRTTLLVTHSAGAVALAATALVLRIPEAAAGQGIWLWLMMLAFMEFGVMMAQDVPTRAALASTLVPPMHRTTAVTLHWLVFAAAILVGAPTAGWLIERVGFSNVYAIAAAGHVLVLPLLWVLRGASEPADPHASSASMLANLREGIRYLGTDATMRWTVMLSLVAQSAGSVAMGILVAPWISEVLRLDAAGWGRMALFWGLGGVLANAWLSFSGNYRNKGWLFIGGATLFGLGVLEFSAVRTVPLATLGILLSGFGSQLVITVGTAIAQGSVPERLLGRVIGLLWLAQGASQASGLLFGTIGQAIGLQLLYPALGAAILLAVAITALRSPLRHAH